MFGIRGQRSGVTDSPLPPASRWTWITSLLLVIIGGVVGFILGRFGPAAFALKYNAKWDIVNVLTLLVTIVIALYVQHAVTFSTEVSRERRRYLAELVKQVADDWSSFHALFRQERPDQNTVAAAIRTVDLGLITLRDALAMCSVSVTSIHMESAWLQYRRALSDFPDPLTTAGQALLQKHFVDGRKCASWLVLALPTS